MSGKNNLHTKRISLTVPEHILQNLDKVAVTMGYTRSALVSHLLDSPSQQMAALLDELMDGIETPERNTRRSTFHTRSVLQAEINSMQSDLLDMSDDMWVGEKNNGH